MATIDFVEYEDANPEVRQVYDGIMATRKIDWVNNFWKALAVQPELLRRTWNGVKEVMAPGNIDMLTKEMIYIAVSVSNGCQYCINSHTTAARKKGMTEEMLSELMAVVGMANQTNALANGFQIDVDEAFQKGGRAFNQNYVLNQSKGVGMIVHQREIGYGENYKEFFEALIKAKEYLEKKYPEVSVDLMYSLAGKRGRATIQTRYASLADYERIDAEADKDEAYSELLEPIMSPSAHPVVDQFCRLIQS